MNGDNDRLLIKVFDVHSRHVQFVVRDIEHRGYACMPNQETLLIREEICTITGLAWKLELGEPADLLVGHSYRYTEESK